MTNKRLRKNKGGRDYLRTINELLTIIDIIKSARIISYLEKAYPLLVSGIKKSMMVDFLTYRKIMKKELENA